MSLLKKRIQGVKQDILIENDVMQLDVYGIKDKLFFSPGHTAGSISLVPPEEK